MKLYLFKHGLNAALKRWGSIENLEEEKQKRESVLYKRKLDESIELISNGFSGSYSSQKANPKAQRKKALSDLISSVRDR